LGEFYRKSLKLEKISFKKYLETRNRNLSRLFSEISETHDENAIHNIRVEIKKIKAVGRLLKHFKKKFIEKKQVKQLNEIFIAAGKIRDNQIEINKLKLYNLNIHLSAYVSLIEKKIKIKENDIIKKIKSSNLDLKKTILNTRLSFNDLHSYILACIYTINDMNASNIHKTRKKLKDAQYLINLVKSEMFGKFEIQNHKLVHNIGELNDLIRIKNNIKKSIIINRHKKMIYNNIDTLIKNLNRNIILSSEKIKKYIGH